MPDGMLPSGGADAGAGRADRAPLVAFAADAPTEQALREGLSAAVPTGLDIRRGTARAALAALARMPTPRTLLIDVGGDPQPLAALADLAQVVEPDTRVLIVGDRQDMNFYRQITRGLGAQEYLYKPLVPDMVARLFAPVVLGQPAGGGSEEVRGGRVIAITGARGGVGATTLAANLAWQFAHISRRHTVLLDADLHAGSAAMLLGGRTGPGLRAALEAPQRVDELFVDRAALPIDDRLHVLAGEEKLTDQPDCAAGAVDRLLGVLRRRYNFVVADVRFAPVSPNRDLLDSAQQRVVVLLPTLPCVRDALRLLALPAGAAQARRPVVVLNRAGSPGGLSRAQVEEALELKLDVVVPDLPRTLAQAETLGVPAVSHRGGYRTAIAALVAQVAAGPMPRRRSLFGRGR